MKTLLFVFLLWLPLSFLIESLVQSTAGEFQKFPKKALYYVLTFPTFWFGAIQRGLGRFLSSGSLAKVGAWFKS